MKVYRVLGVRISQQFSSMNGLGNKGRYEYVRFWHLSKGIFVSC